MDKISVIYIKIPKKPGFLKQTLINKNIFSLIRNQNLTIKTDIQKWSRPM